jgi:hypothetical protein
VSLIQPSVKALVIEPVRLNHYPAAHRPARDIERHNEGLFERRNATLFAEAKYQSVTVNAANHVAVQQVADAPEHRLANRAIRQKSARDSGIQVFVVRQFRLRS